jgi:hypothetical protein
MAGKADEYVGRLPSPQKEICAGLRELVKEAFPGIKEEMKWGVMAYGGGTYYIVALKTHVNFGVSLKSLPKKAAGMLGGGGKTMKHLEISSPSELVKAKELLAALKK